MQARKEWIVHVHFYTKPQHSITAPLVLSVECRWMAVIKSDTGKSNQTLEQVTFQIYQDRGPTLGLFPSTDPATMCSRTFPLKLYMPDSDYTAKAGLCTDSIFLLLSEISWLAYPFLSSMLKVGEWASSHISPFWLVPIISCLMLCLLYIPLHPRKFPDQIPFQ